MPEPVTQEDMFATFYGNESGRRVFQWMHVWIDDHIELSPETALARCLLCELLKDIKVAAGLTDPMELIRMEAQAAATIKEPEKPETNDTLGV